MLERTNRETANTAASGPGEGLHVLKRGPVPELGIDLETSPRFTEGGRPQIRG